jgi:hypothetical protein
MKKSEIKPMPTYFDRYIKLVEDIELSKVFENSLIEIDQLDINLLNGIGVKTYAPNKWTVKEIIQHIIDIERLLCPGVLRFARNESDFVISFNEDEIARNSKANSKDFVAIKNELRSIRLSTIALYQSFDNEDLLKTGINWKYEISVLAMGFNIIGHQKHHFDFINNYYHPLTGT